MALPYYLYANNAQSTLLSNAGPTDPTITLPNGDGAKFPNPTTGQSFMLTLEDTAGNIEIVECTGRSTDVLTVTRGREGTLARTWSAGAAVEARHTAGTMAQADWNHAAGQPLGVATLDATSKIPIAQFDTPLATYGDNRWNVKLNFTPVQQGGGTGQATNKVYIGWSAGSKLKAQVDSTDLGAIALETWVTGTATALKATALATARNIAVSGVVSGNANFDGTGNINIGTSMAANAIGIANVNGLQGALDSKAVNNATNAANITFTGTVTAGAIVDNSDENLKDDIVGMTVTDAYHIIQGLRPVRYTLKATQKPDFGFGAGEARPVVPELVHEDQRGMLAFGYGRLTSPLTRVVQDLIRRIDDLERR